MQQDNNLQRTSAGYSHKRINRAQWRSVISLVVCGCTIGLLAACNNNGLFIPGTTSGTTTGVSTGTTGTTGATTGTTGTVTGTTATTTGTTGTVSSIFGTYVGTFQSGSTAAQPLSVTINPNLSITGNANGAPISGTLTSVAAATSSFGFLFQTPFGGPAFQGSISGNTASGAWRDPNGVTGTWTATLVGSTTGATTGTTTGATSSGQTNIAGTYSGSYQRMGTPFPAGPRALSITIDANNNAVATATTATGSTVTLNGQIDPNTKVLQITQTVLATTNVFQGALLTTGQLGGSFALNGDLGTWTATKQ